MNAVASTSARLPPPFTTNASPSLPTAPPRNGHPPSVLAWRLRRIRPRQRRRPLINASPWWGKERRRAWSENPIARAQRNSDQRKHHAISPTDDTCVDIWFYDASVSSSVD